MKTQNTGTRMNNNDSIRPLALSNRTLDLVKKGIAVTFILVTTSLFSVAQEGSWEWCVTRGNGTAFPSGPTPCTTASGTCTGSCNRLAYTSCHDCVGGLSKCNPPAGGCTSKVESSACGISLLPLSSCGCPTFGTWTVVPGTTAPGADACS